MAKSLLDALVRVISDASVTVEILVLLQNYKQRFLELLRTTYPVVDEGGSSNMPTKEQTEQSLTDRIEEINAFQALKVKVLSFTRLCDLIQPGEIWTQNNVPTSILNGPLLGLFVLFFFFPPELATAVKLKVSITATVVETNQL